MLCNRAKLDAATAQAILARIVSWTVCFTLDRSYSSFKKTITYGHTRLIFLQVRLDRAGEGHLVRKKLCAALGTYFLQSSVQWPRPLLHLAASLAHGDVVAEVRAAQALLDTMR